MFLILDNLARHKSADFVCWPVAHGVMPIYTPVGGSWLNELEGGSHLNMAESIQRILTRRALAGRHPETPQDIIAFKGERRHSASDG